MVIWVMIFLYSSSMYSTAAAAKSRQSCLDSVRPHRQQPTRPHRPWDSPGKNTGVGCHFPLQCVKVKSLSCVPLFGSPWTAAYQAPLSMGFSRQEYWSGVPLPSSSHTWLLSTQNVTNLNWDVLSVKYTLPLKMRYKKYIYIIKFSINSCWKGILALLS